MQATITTVLEAYGIATETCQVEKYGSGLINTTWKIQKGAASFILQRLNDKVFQNPYAIADNLSLLNEYLRIKEPAYPFAAPIAALNKDLLVDVPEKGYFRLFHFVSGSHTVDVVQTPGQAYEAARQFGQFTKVLREFDAGNLQITIPYFHDLSYRFRQFREALEYADPHRKSAALDGIETIFAHQDIVSDYEYIRQSPDFRLRVTHHDTKISNVLFDNSGKGIGVIDLDTVMPGYFISDVGDMMRTYLSPANEEETDFSKVKVREAYYQAILDGYLSEMGGALSQAEKSYFLYAGRFMIYMQAIRFMTDYLRNDIYYGASHESHNLLRAQNQLVLLKELESKEKLLAGTTKALSK